MKTYSVRCRHKACRVRRVVKTHPDDMQAERCESCGHAKGWRYEARDYNRQGLCDCDGPTMQFGRAYPHRTSHPLCDKNPNGYRNQALARGVKPEELPLELMGTVCTDDEPPF